MLKFSNRKCIYYVLYIYHEYCKKKEEIRFIIDFLNEVWSPNLLYFYYFYRFCKTLSVKVLYLWQVNTKLVNTFAFARLFQCKTFGLWEGKLKSYL